MNKIWLLTLCSSLVFAENPMSSEEEIVIPASVISEESIVHVAAPTLPDSQPPEAALLPTQEVTLLTETPPQALPPATEQTLQVPSPSITQQLELDPEEDIAAIEKEEREVAEEITSSGIVIDLRQVFAGSPTIYSVLLILSLASVGIWAYALLNLRNSQLLPAEEFEALSNQLHARSYEVALDTCRNTPTLFFGMVATAIRNRHQGSAAMLEMMKAEGRRMSIAYWQKINLLNEIAIIAPMIGLLGTVLGMFYAFYDLNRSTDSISALFDGLGISVGTTVGGLIVAILALTFHAMTKYRLMKQLTLIEAQAERVACSLKDNP